MLKAGDLKKGKTVIHNGELAVVHEATHIVKGKGRSLMRVKLKSMKTGTIYDLRFNMDDRLEVPFVESKEYEFLYNEGENFVIMDLETYDQIPVGPDIVGESAKWLKPNERITCQIYEDEIISFEPPFVVELEVKETPPVVKGSTATNQNKEAILETGVKIRVAPFIEPGEVVRVDTRTGEYVERAK